VADWSSYLKELHRVKDLAYGDAWCRRGEAAGIFPNVARKFDRWNRIRAEPGAVGSVEPLDDTLADLLIYAVKYLLWLLERNPEAGKGLPIRLPPSTAVADAIGTLTDLPSAAHSDVVLADAFDVLEKIFISGSPDNRTIDSRVQASWSLACGAWGELRGLPVPVSATSPAPAMRQEAPLARGDVTADLVTQLLAAMAERPGDVLLLGLTPTAIEMRAELVRLGLAERLIGIADPSQAEDRRLGILDWAHAVTHNKDYLVVTSDDEKEALLARYVAGVSPEVALPKVLISGLGHLAFRDRLYAELDAPALVQSYATGYPFTRVHMFQHLVAATEAGLVGAVVEFGAFKGGTTAWLARVTRRLGLDVPILAFDSWDGFPPRRSVLDMYTHPRCVYSDLEAVRRHLEPLGVELVPGDISDTAPSRLRDLPILLAFVDTDNYSPAAAALQALIENVVPGGAIVFDHFTTTAEYVYTLGERMAGQKFLKGRGFFQVHGTGVFIRMPTIEVSSQGQES
jgi:O-methyltransferase